LSFIKIGRRVAYHRDDLDAFIACNRHASTSAVA
jgi:hypothetical protein